MAEVYVEGQEVVDSDSEGDVPARNEDASVSLAPSALEGKKLKKAMKRSAKGGCNSLQQYASSFASGVTGLPEVHADAEVLRSRGEAAYSYDSAELRGLLTALLLGKEAIPRSLHLKNRFFVRNVIVLHVANWADDSQHFVALSALLAEVNAERAAADRAVRARQQTALQPLAGVRVSRSAEKEILSLPRCMLCVPVTAAADELGAALVRPVQGRDKDKNKDKKGSQRARGGKKARESAEGAQEAGTGAEHEIEKDNENENDEPAAAAYEPLLAPSSHLQMWGYPWLVCEASTGMQDLYKPPTRKADEEVDKAEAEAVEPDQDAKKQRTGDASDSNCAPAGGAEQPDTKDEAAPYVKDPATHYYGSCWDLVPAAAEAAALRASSFQLEVAYGGATYSNYGCTYERGSVQQEALYGSSIAELQQQLKLSLPLPLVAIDCEMCQTAAGSELARLTLLDVAGNVLLDAFVQPELPVLDYVTKFSGITEAILASHATLTLAQAQLAFQRLVCADSIVVGHSADSDTKALRIFHKRFIDTALLYPHPRGFPLRIKLSILAADHLKLNIQSHAAQKRNWREGGRNEGARGALSVFMKIAGKGSNKRGIYGPGAQEGGGDGGGEEDNVDNASPEEEPKAGRGKAMKAPEGHDSVVDARAALQLAKLKAKHGVAYGFSPRCFAKETGAQGVSVLALAHVPVPAALAVPEAAHHVALSNAGFFWDDAQTAAEHADCIAGDAQSVLCAGSSAGAVSAAVQFVLSVGAGGTAGPSLPPLSLTVVNLQHCAPPPAPASIDEPRAAGTFQPTEEERAERTAVVKGAVHALLSALTARADSNRGGGMLVLTAQRPLNRALSLRSRQYNCMTGKTAAIWNAGDQRQLKEAAALANNAVVSFATVE